MANDTYNISQDDGFVRLKVNGAATADEIQAMGTELTAAIEQSNADKMLCDIRNMGKTDTSMGVQTSGIGVLWQLRGLKKAAFVFADQDMLDMLTGSLHAVHLDSKFKPFSDETQAIAWLKET